LEAVVVVHVIVAPEEEVGLADTAEIAGGLMTLLTVTEILAAVVFNPAESVATAVSVCPPEVAVVVSHEI
jgi:hypothetical protein